MKEQELPPDWGQDPITDFIEKAHHNTLASYANLKTEYNLLVKIDKLFRDIVNNLTNTREFVPSFFLLRSHSSFLGAVRLGLSGQIPETYMVLRGTLENALYGLYISQNPANADTWLSRHDDKKSKQKTRDIFSYGKVIGLLKSIDVKSYTVTSLLYDRCIDYGAHPNERSVTSVMNLLKNDEVLHYEVAYLGENTPAFLLALKTSAQVGVCALNIFQNVFKERFDNLGISAEIDKLIKIL
jgi:hypothetical protein